MSKFLFCYETYLDGEETERGILSPCLTEYPLNDGDSPEPSDWCDISTIGLDSLIQKALSLGITANCPDNLTEWFTTVDGAVNCHTGEVTFYSLHLRSDRFDSLFRRVNQLLSPV